MFMVNAQVLTVSGHFTPDTGAFFRVVLGSFLVVLPSLWGRFHTFWFVFPSVRERVVSVCLFAGTKNNPTVL